MAQSRPSQQRKPILVALDLSDHSLPVLGHACRLAAGLGQPLLVVHVVHETEETVGMYRRDQTTADTTPMHDLARAMLEERIAAFRTDCGDIDRIGDVQLVVADGIPQTRIPELAESYAADMIVMGRHHRRGLSRLLHPSVSQDVGRYARCPVVLVDEEARAPSTVPFPPTGGHTAAVHGA
jgi:nucleotide-binding universal stress UspA family protein